jgi:hypothetical protein
MSTLNPLGPIAGAFYQDNSEIATIMGPIGSAKTTALLMRLVRHAYEQRPHNGVRRTRFAIARNTGPQLRDTTIASWLKLFPENIYGKFANTSKTHHWRFKPAGDKYLLDAEFRFRALDDDADVSNLLSAEYTGFAFNEVKDMASTILAHAGTRAGRYPGGDQGGCTWKGWIADTNPWPATSDLHDWFVADPRPGYKFFKQPGGLEEDAENLENLVQTPETLALPWNDPRRREQGRQYYKAAERDFSKADFDLFVRCKYGVSRDGKPVFVSYDDNVHCKSIEVLKGLGLYIGYDNTGRHPAAVVAQKTNEGQWRVIYEFAAESMGMKQHAKELKRFLAEELSTCKVLKITCDPAGKAKDSGELDMRMLVAMEFPEAQVLNARTNDIPTRIEAVDGTMRRLVNGEPALIIHPRCKALRAACIHKYHYRRMKLAGTDRYAEEPEKITPYADVADALEYLMLGGGEGRIHDSGKDPWPSGGRIITPQQPRGWNPLGVKD